MNPADLQTFNRAVAQAQAGEKAAAYSVLYQLYPAYPNNPNLLLWLAFTADNLAVARQRLNQAAQADPANSSLAGAFGWLAEQEQAQAYVSPVAQFAGQSSSFEPGATAPVSANFQAAPRQTSSSVSTATADIDFLLSSPPPAAPAPVNSAPPISFATPSPETPAPAAPEPEPAFAGAPEATTQTFEPARRKIFSSTVVIGLLGLIVVGFIGLVTFLVITSSGGLGDMPAPNNSRSLDLGAAGQSMEVMKAFGMSGYALYVTTEKPSSLQAFYDSKMTGKGWQKSTGSAKLSSSATPKLSGGNTLTFQKDKRASMIVIAGPLSAEDAKTFASTGGPFSEKPKAGESVVILMEIDFSKFLGGFGG